jgi:tetratricopeptide (TPR) repeat protein
VEIAEHLEGDADTIARLRGSAWRTKAYALYYTGAIADADAAVRESAERYSHCSLAEYDIARLNIVRSLVDRALERIPAAAAYARQSADVFAAFGDDRRTASARLAHVHLLYARGEYQEAMRVLRPLEKSHRVSGDPTTHAQVLANLGFCFWKLGDFDGALKHHEAAAVLFDDLGNRTEALRERWNVASVLATAGRIDEAFTRLEGVRREFEDLGIIHAVAQVSLEMAELHLTRGEFDCVEVICQSVMEAFRTAGLSHTTFALTALAYMDEAVRNRKATPALARHVREYIRRLPEDGLLLFAPPPA